MYSQDHRKGGQPITSYEMADFSEAIESMQVHPLSFTGCFFSWNSKVDGKDRVFNKIDRCLGNLDWMQFFSDVFVRYMEERTSDHSPLYVDLKVESISSARPFKFFNYMVDHSSFPAIVKNAWTSNWYRLKSQIHGCLDDTDLVSHEMTAFRELHR